MENFSCVYALENKVTGEIYVGSSKEYPKRVTKYHFSRLRNNRHKSYILQRSWNENGESSFIHYVLERCPYNELGFKEEEWLKKLILEGKKVYNFRLGTNDRHYQTEETKELLRNINTGKIFDEEFGNKVSECLKASYKRRGGSPLTGKSRNPEVVAKITASIREGFANGRRSPMLGRKQSEEHKRKIREATTGKFHVVSEEGLKAMDEARRRLSPARLAHIARLAELARQRKILSENKSIGDR